jgi:O-methyltransferase
MQNLPAKFRKALRYPVEKILLRGLYKRIEQIEYRSFNRRFYAIEQITEYLIGAQIEGDYLEFGVYKGTTFAHAHKWMAPYFKDMKFVAFDSFEGLPAPKGLDALDGYSSHFYAKQFECTEAAFLKNIRRNGVDMRRVRTVKGWFDKTLALDRRADYAIERIAVAWIDCDLYESTVPVLKFITPHLCVGSVIVFDDWRCYRNHPDFGEQRACREWLEANPGIELQQLFSFGWNGIAFTIVSC